MGTQTWYASYYSRLGSTLAVVYIMAVGMPSVGPAYQHIGIMAMLLDAGVVDTGEALISAARPVQEASVKFLLERQGTVNTMGIVDYVNARDSLGITPLFGSVLIRPDRFYSPRIVRLFLNAGADATSAVRLTPPPGRMTCYPADQIIMFDNTLEFTTNVLRYKICPVQGTPAQLHRVEVIRRLLLQVEPVHAVSWLWAGDDLSTTHGAEVEISSEATPTTETPLGMMLPILRRRAQRHGAVLAAFTRCVETSRDILWCCH